MENCQFSCANKGIYEKNKVKTNTMDNPDFIVIKVTKKQQEIQIIQF